jgi:hypothetical protein
VPDVYVRTLERAAQIEGGEEALALRLKVTPRAVDLVSDQQFERPEAKAARSGPEL